MSNDQFTLQLLQGKLSRLEVARDAERAFVMAMQGAMDRYLTSMEQRERQVKRIANVHALEAEVDDLKLALEALGHTVSTAL